MKHIFKYTFSCTKCLICICLFYYTDNGYQNVHFHVVIDLQSLRHFRKEDERKVRETVANIVECKIDEVVVKGYLSSSSFFLVLSFKMIYVNKLLALKQQEKDELSKLRIDFFKVGSETVYVESLKGKLCFYL